jgi:MFS family permease
MISLARYSALLARPDLKMVLAASVVGRLPIGVTGLAILLLAQEATASYMKGGAVAAAYVIGLACFAPMLGRLIDRSGPHQALRWCAGAFPTALLALLAAIHLRAPLQIAMLGAFVAGASFPPITVCMRTFFRRRLADESLLGTAYSLESVLIETIFIIGPVVVAAFVAYASAAAAVAFAAGCGLLGTFLFLRSPALRGWQIEQQHAGSLFGPLAEPGFPVLFLVILGYSTAFGLIEIGVTAYAAERQAPALAGVLLGLMSAGSAVGGLTYGSRSWRLPLGQQFAFALLVLACGIGVLALPMNLWWFAIASIFAGVIMAPTLTIQSMLVARNARPRHLTEAFTWSSTGLLAGVGAGIAFGGWLIERWDSSAAFVAGMIAAGCASALAATSLRAGQAVVTSS